MFALNDSPRTLLDSVAVGVVTLLLVAAPWPFGGYLFQHQFFLWIPALICTLLACLSISNNPQVELHRIPLVLFPALLLIAIAAVQLLPVDLALTDWKGAVLGDWLPPLSKRLAWSIDASLTRVQVLRFACACGLIWSAAHLFEDAGHRRFLWWSLAVNGAVLSIFGMVQRYTWNGKLFWTVELAFGGQPFASYVNRNHAAGYISMCLGCSLALWWWTLKWDAKQKVTYVDYKNIFNWAIIGLVLVNLLGVFASLSRGGILAAVVACLLLVVLAEQSVRLHVLGLFGTVIVLLGIVLAMTNVTGSLQDRLAAIDGEANVQNNGRLRHWQDTWPAVLDSPLGTGLGTYRLANRPYQAHPTAGEYHNADNLYFEMLVEVGWPGLALIVMGLLAVAWRVRQLWRMPLTDAQPLAILGLFLLVSQGLQAGTDFGPLMTANMLCLATLVGCLYVPISDNFEYANDTRGAPRTAHVAIGILLLLPGIPALIVFDHASRTEKFLRALPEASADVPRAAIDSQISVGNKLLAQFPDHSQLHAGMGQLYVQGFRKSLFDEITAANPNPQLAPQVWNSTSLPVLFEVARSAADPTALKSDPAVLTYLIPARARFESLRTFSMTSPESYSPLAATAPMLAEPDAVNSIALWKVECALLPDSSNALLAAGRMLQVAGDQAACERAWKQALATNHDKPAYLIQRMQPHCTPEQLLSWLPPREDLWLVYASSTDQVDIRHAAAQGALTLIEQSEYPEPGKFSALRGQAYQLLDNPAKAAELFQDALRLNSTHMEWRVQLAEALQSSGNLEQALLEFQAAARLAPDRGDLKRKIEQLDKSIHADR